MRRLRRIRMPRIRSKLNPNEVRAAVQAVYANRTYEVVPSPDMGGWVIRKVGTKRVLGRFATKAEAIRSTKLRFRKKRSQFIIYNREGRILRSARHGLPG